MDDNIASDVQISHDSMHTILIEHLGCWKFVARWVSWLFTNDQKQVWKALPKTPEPIQ